MGHIVTATLIVAKVGDTERYFAKGAPLPVGVVAEERKRLVAAGVVKYEKDEPAPDPEAAAKAAAEAATKATAHAKAEADAKAAADAKAEADARATADAKAKAAPAK